MFTPSLSFLLLAICLAAVGAKAGAPPIVAGVGEDPIAFAAQPHSLEEAGKSGDVGTGDGSGRTGTGTGSDSIDFSSLRGGERKLAIDDQQLTEEEEDERDISGVVWFVIIFIFVTGTMWCCYNLFFVEQGAVPS